MTRKGVPALQKLFREPFPLNEEVADDQRHVGVDMSVPAYGDSTIPFLGHDSMHGTVARPGMDG